MLPSTMQHFLKENISNREVLGFCAQEVDKALSVQVQRVKAKLLGTVEKMDAQLQKLENNMRCEQKTSACCTLATNTKKDCAFCRARLIMVHHKYTDQKYVDHRRGRFGAILV